MQTRNSCRIREKFKSQRPAPSKKNNLKNNASGAAAKMSQALPAVTHPGRVRRAEPGRMRWKSAATAAAPAGCRVMSPPPPSSQQDSGSH